LASEAVEPGGGVVGYCLKWVLAYG